MELGIGVALFCGEPTSCTVNFTGSQDGERELEVGISPSGQSGSDKTLTGYLISLEGSPLNNWLPSPSPFQKEEIFFPPVSLGQPGRALGGKTHKGVRTLSPSLKFLTLRLICPEPPNLSIVLEVFLW